MKLIVDSVGHYYDHSNWLFKHVKLEIGVGDVVSLEAPSGYGKTTLSKIIAGYEEPREGRILVDGNEIDRKKACPVQLIFQHPEKAINPRWKMKQVLEESWMPTSSDLAEFGIKEEWLSRWPTELSGGELQRFCIVRALAPTTKFLIADEMTTMLDSVTQASIWKSVLSRVERQDIGLIVVSHDEKLLQRVSHRRVDLTMFND